MRRQARPAARADGHPGADARTEGRKTGKLSGKLGNWLDARKTKTEKNCAICQLREPPARAASSSPAPPPRRRSRAGPPPPPAAAASDDKGEPANYTRGRVLSRRFFSFLREAKRSATKRSGVLSVRSRRRSATKRSGVLSVRSRRRSVMEARGAEGEAEWSERKLGGQRNKNRALIQIKSSPPESFSRQVPLVSCDGCVLGMAFS